MKNFEKFKTADERAEMFGRWCSRHVCCSKCELNNKHSFNICAIHWLDLEAEEEKPLPCPGCGNTDMHVHDEIQDPNIYIVCPNCGYRSPGEMNLNDAVSRHNRVARAFMEAEKEGDK